jgi:hypothetical protein
MNKAVFVTEISVQDPGHPSLMVNVSIYKHENGGMFGMDSSYLEQNFDDDTDPLIPDPFDESDYKQMVVLREE